MLVVVKRIERMDYFVTVFVVVVDDGQLPTVHL
jgi:hypothetical protein